MGLPVDALSWVGSISAAEAASLTVDDVGEVDWTASAVDDAEESLVVWGELFGTVAAMVQVNRLIYYFLAKPLVPYLVEVSMSDLVGNYYRAKNNIL